MTDQTPPLPAGFSVVPAGNQPPPPPDGFAIQNAPDNPFTRWFNSDRNTPSQINDVSTKLPKLGAQAIASMPTDQKTKMQYLARQIFPDMDPKTALSRMGVDSGRVFYIGNDEKAYYAEPGDFSPISEPGRTAAQLPDMAAGAIGPSLGTIGGMAGGLTTAGFGGGVPGAAVGGMAGDAVRQGLAATLAGEQKPITSRITQNLGEGAAQGVGQLAGLGLSKGAGALLNRNPLRVAGYDAGGMTSKRIDQMQQNADLANKMGVQVTPGEAGGISSLLQRQRQIGRQGEGADTLNDFYQKRNTEQLPAGWVKTLDNISPVSAPGIGARNLADASKKVINAAQAARSAKSGPLFDEAYAANPSIASPEIDLILKTPAGSQALKDAAEIMQNDRSFMALPDPEKTALVNELVSIGKMKDPETGAGVASGLKLRSLQYVKEALWDQYKSLAATQPRKAQSVLDNYFNLRNELYRADSTAITDAAERKVLEAGKYQQANEAHAGMSPEVDALKKGLVGLVSKDRASGWQNAPRTMFDIGTADSMSITQARQAFEKAGKMDEWNGAIRSYLQNAWDAAVKNGGDSGPANSIWKNLKSDPRQYANLKAATTPKQMQALDDFFQVAEMVKRAPKEGSPTPTDLNKRPDFAGPAARFFGNVAKGANPLNWADAVGDKIFDVSAGKNVGKLANLITSPDAIQSLRKLKMLKPGTQKFITEAGYLGEAMGLSQLGGYLGGQQPNQLPAMFGGQ